ncbi:MAG: polymer-forming cytoskeletal protein [Acidobacteria bacterium]|nr:polymer-forming cytoskeletal protein [Acidobacteriota bacterium]MBI3278326.1 polymer-forming cytoskeletal protein [Acidobacteriota bacterium]
MWNRRKDDEYPSRNTAQPSHEPAREVTPPPAAAARHEQPATSGSSATIGKAVMVKGQIYSREDLMIDGEVEGTVELQEHRLTVGPNGRVQAGIKAKEIVVLGTIQGNVEAAEKIEIRKEAKLVGDIKTARIVIEDGAYFKGSIDIARPEPAKPAPAAAPKPAQVQPAVPAAASASSEVKR